MPTRDIQEYLDSGEETDVKKGGVTADDSLQDLGEVKVITDALDARVTANEDALAILNNSGLTVMSGSSLTPQTINIVPTPIISFDTLAIEVGVGTEGDVLTQSIKATDDGVFKLRYEAFLSYASNVTITWKIYKNESPFGDAITLTGKGAEVFTLVLISATELLANDILQLYGTASASTDITIAQSNGTLEKTYF